MVESKEITPEIRSQVLFSPTNIRGGAGIRAGAAIRRYTVCMSELNHTKELFHLNESCQ